MPYNEGQLKAIMQRNSSILVSAPAGSGKTKILVGRIIELLKEGYDIFDFLVLTFTEAAGNEMKQRLSEELNALVSSDIDHQLKQHLEKQVLNLPHAYITNFHGFCNLLLMKYGYLVDVMPGFEINSDPSLIKAEVLQECLEEWILNDDFKSFIELYFPNYSFDALERLILSIDNLSHSIDDFYGFVDNMHNNYYADIHSLEDWPLFPYLKKIFVDECTLAMNKLIELKYYCEIHDLDDFYQRPDDQSVKMQELSVPFESYYNYLDERLTFLKQSVTYDSLLNMMKASLPKSYNMTWKEIDPEVKKVFNKMKADIFSSYNKAISAYLEDDQNDFIEKMKISYQAIDMLISKGKLLDQFQNAYQARKKELNQLDFSDLESFTHQLLEPQYGIVDILYNRLKEIMVDEYQDTNQIQESLLIKIANLKQPYIPLFMVGDMKQSIYRFRQADPQIFSSKYDSFSLTDKECEQTHTRRIDLVYNYRSSKIVLDSINFIFNQIMDKEIGGLEYFLDESARLNYDYKGKEKNPSNARENFFKQKELTTEVLIDVYDPKSSLDKEQYEAHMVAQKILDLKENMLLHDKPVTYKDMVVLMRSSVSFLTFKKVFDLYHIPNHIVLSQGLMSSNEVNNILTFLEAIDNPYNDVALLSVLKQPYTCSYIDMETIAKLRIDHKDISLYDTLKLSTDEKIINFLSCFEELRKISSPYELTKKIYDITDYPLFVSRLINGTQRIANLNLLLEIIQQTQINTPYLEDLLYLLRSSSDYAPAQSSNGDQDVVEFMTIHKSKGLEFPIVFVCNMHKQFNTQDSKERLMIDKQLGIALKPRIKLSTDNIKNITVEYENCYRNMVARRQLDESINEEMRILYVALTRAVDKLILTGVIKSMDEVVSLQEKILVNESPDIYHRNKAGTVIYYERLRKTNNYLSWVLSSILRHPDIIKQTKDIEELQTYSQVLQSCTFKNLATTDSTEHAMFSLKFTNDESIEENIPSYSNQKIIINHDLQDKYQQFIYPYDTEKSETIAVTKLQEIVDDHYLVLSHDDDTSLMSASDKGTLVHLFMSTLTFKNDHVIDVINLMFEEGLCDEEGKDILIAYQDKLEGFINSSYYQMICDASYIYKEKAFSYYDKERKQIVHGIFDLVFIYNDNIYVLDYKTDRISEKNSDQALIGKHLIQLNYYQKVLTDMYQKDIHAIIYYLHISKGVEF